MRETLLLKPEVCRHGSRTRPRQYTVDITAWYVSGLPPAHRGMQVSPKLLASKGDLGNILIVMLLRYIARFQLEARERRFIIPGETVHLLLPEVLGTIISCLSFVPHRITQSSSFSMNQSLGS